jgi:hypothetical protein
MSPELGADAEFRERFGCEAALVAGTLAQKVAAVTSS